MCFEFIHLHRKYFHELHTYQILKLKSLDQGKAAYPAPHTITLGFLQ